MKRIVVVVASVALTLGACEEMQRPHGRASTS